MIRALRPTSLLAADIGEEREEVEEKPVPLSDSVERTILAKDAFRRKFGYYSNPEYAERVLK